MKTREVCEWLESENLSCKDLAERLCISEAEVNYWLGEERIPTKYEAAIEKYMCESGEEVSFELTESLMKSLTGKMRSAGYTDLSAYISHVIRTEYGDK